MNWAQWNSLTHIQTAAMLRRKTSKLPKKSSPTKNPSKTIKQPATRNDDIIAQPLPVFDNKEKLQVRSGKAASQKRKSAKQLYREEQEQAFSTASEDVNAILERLSEEYLKLYKEGEELEGAVLGAEEDVLQHLGADVDSDSDTEHKKQVNTV